VEGSVRMSTKFWSPTNSAAPENGEISLKANQTDRIRGKPAKMPMTTTAGRSRTYGATGIVEGRCLFDVRCGRRGVCVTVLSDAVMGLAFSSTGFTVTPREARQP